MKNSRVFLDSNIIIRHLLQDSKLQSPKATKLLEGIALEQIMGYISTLVLHEVTYVLTKVYKKGRSQVASQLIELIALNNLVVLDLDKTSVVSALEDFENTKVDFPDCVFKQISLLNKLAIASFDKDFRKIGVKTV